MSKYTQHHDNHTIDQYIRKNEQDIYDIKYAIGKLITEVHSINEPKAIVQEEPNNSFRVVMENRLDRIERMFEQQRLEQQLNQKYQHMFDELQQKLKKPKKSSQVKKMIDRQQRLLEQQMLLINNQQKKYDGMHETMLDKMSQLSDHVDRLQKTTESIIESNNTPKYLGYKTDFFNGVNNKSVSFRNPIKDVKSIMKHSVAVEDVEEEEDEEDEEDEDEEEEEEENEDEEED